jgi:hypothetical protein
VTFVWATVIGVWRLSRCARGRTRRPPLHVRSGLRLRCNVCVVCSFAPTGLGPDLAILPTAYAVGCDLSLLRSWRRDAFVAPVIGLPRLSRCARGRTRRPPLHVHLGCPPLHSFAPTGLGPGPRSWTHGLRRGLFSFAPSELGWLRLPSGEKAGSSLLALLARRNDKIPATLAYPSFSFGPLTFV